MSGTDCPFVVFFGYDWEDVVGAWEVESFFSWEHSVLVDLSTGELDWSEEPFVNVVVVPWEVDEFISLELVHWLINVKNLVFGQQKC